MPRVKPHAKIHTSLRSHHKTAAMYSNNDLLSTYVRILTLAIERYADKTNDSFHIHDRELKDITGKGRIDVARKLLRSLAEVSPISARLEGDLWLISLPNFAKKQGFGPRNGKDGDTPQPQPQPLPLPRTDSTSRPSVAAAPEKGNPPTRKGERSVAKSKELALQVWPELVERVASYGKTWFSEPQGKQLEMLTARIRKGATRVQLLAAIDGFAALHGDRLEDPDQPMRKYFRATTIYQASKFEEYLEAEADMSAPDARKARRVSDAEDILNKLNSYSEDDDDE